MKISRLTILLFTIFTTILGKNSFAYDASTLSELAEKMKLERISSGASCYQIGSDVFLSILHAVEENSEGSPPVILGITKNQRTVLEEDVLLPSTAEIPQICFLMCSYEGEKYVVKKREDSLRAIKVLGYKVVGSKQTTEDILNGDKPILIFTGKNTQLFDEIKFSSYPLISINLVDKWQALFIAPIWTNEVLRDICMANWHLNAQIILSYPDQGFLAINQLNAAGGMSGGVILNSNKQIVGVMSENIKFISGTFSFSDTTFRRVFINAAQCYGYSVSEESNNIKIIFNNCLVIALTEKKEILEAIESFSNAS